MGKRKRTFFCCYPILWYGNAINFNTYEFQRSRSFSEHGPWALYPKVLYLSNCSFKYADNKDFGYIIHFPLQFSVTECLNGPYLTFSHAKRLISFTASLSNLLVSRASIKSQTYLKFDHTGITYTWVLRMYGLGCTIGQMVLWSLLLLHLLFVA